MGVSQKVLDAIEILTNSSISKANYDRTIQAQVLSCEDASIGEYRCRYQDSTIYAYSNNLQTSYNKGDYVYILVPSNDMKKEKTILCTSNRRGNNFISETKEEDKYNIIGNNCILSTRDFYLNTDNINYSYNIYSYGNIANVLRIDEEAVGRYIKNANAFKVNLMIKTSIPISRQSRGSYGLTFTLVFKDNTLEKEVERVYIINEDNMSGNPYKYKNNTKQTIIFGIDGENFVRIKQINLFNKDFPNAAAAVTSGDLHSGDIVISAMAIYGLETIDTDLEHGVAISFSTPKGIILSNSVESVPIIAQVKVNNKLVLSNQKLQFYWGIEDAGITPNSMYYNKYLGGGWRCLNEYNSISSIAVDWVPNNGTFNYTKAFDDTLLTTDNNIKVAVLFNNKIYTKEITIYNGKNTNIILTSNTGTVFYYDKGTPKITCSITNGTETYSYKWGQEDNNGTFSTIDESLNNVQIIMKEITDFVKIKCSVYEEAIYRGTAAITLINSIKPDELSLIEGWDGKTVQINEDSILSPRVGAGKKDSNGFTGVVMGVLKQYPEDSDIKEKIGLFGYANSERSFFLNSENGSAIFGLDAGSIVIDPSATKALLYSKNFWEDYSETELPVNYTSDNQSGRGMLIDLSTPGIRFGSGAFSVNENGILTATNVNVTGTIITSDDPSNGIFTSTKLEAGKMSIWYRLNEDSAITASKALEMCVTGAYPIYQTSLLTNANKFNGIAFGFEQQDLEAEQGSSIIRTDYRYSLGSYVNDLEIDGARHWFRGRVKIIADSGHTFFEGDPEKEITKWVSPTGTYSLVEIEGNTKIIGELQVDSISVTNGTTITGNQTYSGNLQINGNISSNGKITADNGLAISGAAVFNNSLTINQIFEVLSISIFRDNINISGDKSLQWGNKDFIKYVTLDSDASNYGLYVGATDEKLFLRGTAITSSTAISTSSDKRKKIFIQKLDNRYLQLIKEINPVSFRYNPDFIADGDIHTGFIAQEVHTAMQKCGISDEQFAAFVDINNNGTDYALRYEEFISPMLLYIKSLEKQIKLLKQKVGI